MKQLLSLALILLFFFFTVSPILAQNKQPFINIGDRQKSGAIPGIPAVGNPNASPGNIVSNVLRIMYAFAGIAVLVFIIWGAFDWITAGGDKEKTGAARRKITNSLIGMAILALSAFIVSLFGQIFGINPLNMGIIPTLSSPPR